MCWPDGKAGQKSNANYVNPDNADRLVTKPCVNKFILSCGLAFAEDGAQFDPTLELIVPQLTTEAAHYQNIRNQVYSEQKHKNLYRMTVGQ
jgi:hypothetical protein